MANSTSQQSLAAADLKHNLHDIQDNVVVPILTGNVDSTNESLSARGLSGRAADSFPEAFRVGVRERAQRVSYIGPHAKLVRDAIDKWFYDSTG